MQLIVYVFTVSEQIEFCKKNLQKKLYINNQHVY